MKINGQSQLVIAGNWNISILTPNWFKNEFSNIISDTKDIPVEFRIGGREMRFTLNEILIEPTENRLSFSPKIEDEIHYDIIIELAKGVTEKLPHTPIHAIGHNCTYMLTTEHFMFFDKNDIDKYLKDYRGLWPHVNMNSQLVKHVLEFEEYTLNMSYIIDRKEYSLKFNYHYPVREYPKIQKYVGAFKDHMQEIKTIMEKIIKK